MTNTILAEFVIAVMVIFELVTVCRRGKTQGNFVVVVFLWRVPGIVPGRVPGRVPVCRVLNHFFNSKIFATRLNWSRDPL